MAARCSSPSLSSFFKHDTFLSFRGGDVRQTFISHLNKQLGLSGISTFIDDKIERGQVISPALVTAIENSMCSIVVLSENYASSRWCLEELVKILECKRKKGQRVIPIFYNINPSDVRYQRGKIGKAMAKHERNLKENMEEEQIWRDALTKAANLCGWDSSNQEKFGEAMAKHERNSKEKMERVHIWRDALTEVANLSGWDSRNQNEAMLIEEIIQSILEGMHKDWRKSVDGGMDSMIPLAKIDRKGYPFWWGDLMTQFVELELPFVKINRESVPSGWGRIVQIEMKTFRGLVINLVGAIMARIQLINCHDDLTVRILKRTAISIRASMRSVSPNDKAITGDLIRLVDEMRDLIEFIGPLDDAAARDLRQLTGETKALTQARLPPICDGMIWRWCPCKAGAPRVDKKLHMEEVRSISSDHVGEDSKGQGKLSTISGCKNLSIKFRTSIKARLLGLTWSTTIKSRLRVEQVLIVLHYVNDSIVSSYTNASILILVVGSWNLLYVLFLQSCEDVFHGSPVTIFCELKLSDLRSCEVGCFGNPLNWGDGVVRGIIPAEVEGEEAGKGKP
uniref:TIR domain-containing protein n=1 Tax=Vitis vinifera TaxID=29760 RepID=A5C4G5_VITVI|nr:hypothetical protein VITISV_003860 [Vitis vinifera]